MGIVEVASLAERVVESTRPNFGFLKSSRIWSHAVSSGPWQVSHLVWPLVS